MDTFAFGLALGAGFLVAALRMYFLGDLPPIEVLRSSAIWGLGTFMVLGGALWLVTRSLSFAPASALAAPKRPGAPKARTAAAAQRTRKPGAPIPEVPPEVLNQVEEEAALVERPEAPRIQGTPPPEVAESLRNIMKAG